MSNKTRQKSQLNFPTRHTTKILRLVIDPSRSMLEAAAN